MGGRSGGGGAQDGIFVITQLRLAKKKTMGYFKGIILYRNLFLLAGIFWVCLRSLQTALFDFFDRIMFRHNTGGGGGRLSSSTVSGKVSVDDGVVVVGPGDSSGSVFEAENLDIMEDEEEVEGLILGRPKGKDSPKFLSFKFPSLEECSKRSFECEDGRKSGKVDDIEEVPRGGRSALDEELSVDSEFSPASPAIKKVGDEPRPDRQVCCELEKPGKIEVFGKEDFSERISEKLRWLCEKEMFVSESDSDSMSSSHDCSLMSRLLDSNSEEGFFSDGDLDEGSERIRVPDSPSPTMETEKSDTSMEEGVGMEFEESEERENASENYVFDDENSKSMSADQSNVWDMEEDSKLESMWEHQDLIEQIKMELEKSRRAKGLPTIPEDSEGPKITEDLRPWKIDERDQHEETIGELHKVYKSYRERMRKFDVLNYQKMYALGFRQTKDPAGFASSQKATSEGITSLLMQTFKICRDEKKAGDDPTVAFVRELHSDLETVYVGQMCLSWEFLHWQYTKALELWESDQDSSRRYNEVAGEFQQFQVVLQRFLENESFEGTRVQSYVRNRHFLRNLIQIPVIKEDSSKDRRRVGFKGKGEYVVTSDELVEILEESIRIFWRFVRADKDSSRAFPKGRRGTKPELQNPRESELSLAEVKTTLEKKEKTLKEVLKCGNCILRKFQKGRGDNSSDQVLYFFSQVDMKLIRRVLNMSRLTTDQLSWCSGKLSRIVFVRRKIHVEPSFSLFPC